MSLLRRIEKGESRGGSGNEAGETAANADVGSTPADLDVLAIRLRTEVFAKLDPAIREHPTPQARNEINNLLEALLSAILVEEKIGLNRGEKDRLFDPVLAELLGPLEALLADETIRSIWIYDHKTIYTDRNGRLERPNVVVSDEAHVLKNLNRILEPVG